MICINPPHITVCFFQTNITLNDLKMSLANLPDSDLIRPLGREEFDQLWDDALDPASTDQELSDIAQQELLRTQVIPAAFSLTNWAGAYMFDIKIGEVGDSKSGKNKSDSHYSSVLSKLYIRQNAYVDVKLLYSLPETYSGKLSVSACLMFSSPEHSRKHVTVCYQHSHQADDSLRDLLAPYILRMFSNDQEVKYFSTPNGRHIVQIDNLPLRNHRTNYQTTPIKIKFTDLSSCPGGINRRDTSLVFCLIDQNGQAVGRKVLPVKICTSPKRDKAHDEKLERLTQRTETGNSGTGDSQSQDDKDKFWVLATSRETFESLKKVILYTFSYRKRF